MFRDACSFRQRYAELAQSSSGEYGAFLFHFGINDFYKQDVWQEKLAEFRPATQYIRLSKRETELVGLLRKGLRTKEIADQLKSSHHTVRNIRQRMFEKYNVNNSIELLNKAV